MSHNVNFFRAIGSGMQSVLSRCRINNIAHFSLQAQDRKYEGESNPVTEFFNIFARKFQFVELFII